MPSPSLRAGPVPALATCALVACFSPSQDEGDRGDLGKADDTSCDQPEVSLEPAVGGFAFTQPVVAVQHGSAPDIWYVGEQRGSIWRIQLHADGSATPSLFADLRSRVNSQPNEAGLLGIALHPDFDLNGEVYLSYTAPSGQSPANLQSRVSRFTASGGQLDASSEEVLIRVEQPFANHNGGQVAFGPDGFLYLGLGDGGSAGDPQGNGQDRQSMLGKLHRIDVDSGSPFGIPGDNPFLGDADTLDTIFALGLRNPWRFSWDRETGELWLADVGQDRAEEVNIIEAGKNYGWKAREGFECFLTESCPGEFEDPVVEYDRFEGISVTGGYVYRGAAMPDRVGQYLVGDFGSGKVWAVGDGDSGEPALELLAATGRNPSSFAEGTDGEVYLLDYSSGGIFRLALAAPVPCPENVPDPQGAMDSVGVAPTMENLYFDVLEPRCGPCHTLRGMGGLAMRNPDQAFENLVDRPAQTPICAGRTRVVPGDPDGSLFLSKVTGQNLCGPMMPTTGPLGAGDIERIRDWIAEGAQR